MALPQDVINQIELLVEEKFNELTAARKIDVTSEATSLAAFEAQMMQGLNGNEVITQSFFRIFLDWLGRYYTYNLNLDEKIALAACRYVTPVDLAGTPDVGKIIAPVASLVLTGAGVQPTVPVPANTTPDQAGFNPATHLMPGGFAYNVTDNLWFYRGGDTIYELKDALSITAADVSGLAEAITAAGFVAVEAGKGLSTNDLTNLLKTAYDAAVTHKDVAAIHKEYDNSTIKLIGDKLAVDAAAIKALFSGTAPIVETDGAISISVNTEQFEIVDNKLQIKAGVLGGGDPVLLAYNPTTHILTIGPAGAGTVDLSSLGGGAVDLSNYVKKTGEANQTIAGNLNVTGEVTAYSS